MSRIWMLQKTGSKSVKDAASLIENGIYTTVNLPSNSHNELLSVLSINQL